MLNALFEALAALLMPLDIPVFLADCVPDGVRMPYLAMEVEVPVRPAEVGKLTLTLWCAGDSANAERIRLGDELAMLLPARGVCLHQTEHAIALRPTGRITCIHGKGAIALRQTCTVGCVPLASPVTCTLWGEEMAKLSDHLHVLDVHEEAPCMREVAYPCAAGGTRVLLRQRERLSIRIDFAVLDPEPKRRQATLRAVAAWAEQGGLLGLSTRPGLQLGIHHAVMSAPSAEDWTETLSLTLTACDPPWWEATQPVSSTITEAGTLEVPGDADSTPVDVLVTHRGEGTLTRLHLRCGATQMTFEGLALPAGGTFRLNRENGVLSAEIGEKNVLNQRTALSDDELLAPCGQEVSIAVSADQPVTATFMARGRWL